jgi:hypothetical protein
MVMGNLRDRKRQILFIWEKEIPLSDIDNTSGSDIDADHHTELKNLESKIFPETCLLSFINI